MRRGGIEGEHVSSFRCSVPYILSTLRYYLTVELCPSERGSCSTHGRISLLHLHPSVPRHRTTPSLSEEYLATLPYGIFQGRNMSEGPALAPLSRTSRRRITCLGAQGTRSRKKRTGPGFRPAPCKRATAHSCKRYNELKSSVDTVVCSGALQGTRESSSKGEVSSSTVRLKV